jgi:4-hydroxy-tetrahydrodipicolinate reductase
MGRTVCDAVRGADDLELVAEVDVGDDPEQFVASGSEVVVDFTHPDAVDANVRFYLEHGIHAVVGTTGWDDEEIASWRELAGASDANAVIAPNFALGAVLMMHIAKIVAPHMPHVEIIELHHDRKADAPSGTAVMTADGIASVREVEPDVPVEESIAGSRGAERRGIRVHAVRLPGLVAHQEILFGAEGQTLSLRHDTVDRTAFMPGVLLAVRQVPDRPGLTVGLDRLLGLVDDGGS